jgi:hypothetical protein
LRRLIQGGPSARVPLRVGDGSQVLRWAANAACARLAFITGAPGAAVAKRGTALAHLLTLACCHA